MADFLSEWTPYWVPFVLAFLVFEAVLRHARKVGSGNAHWAIWIVVGLISFQRLFRGIGAVLLGVGFGCEDCFNGTEFALVSAIAVAWVAQGLRCGIVLKRMSTAQSQRSGAKETVS